MKPYMINIIIGLFIFLIGGLLHDYLGFVFIGDFLAYLGIIYFTTTAGFLVYKWKSKFSKKTYLSKQRLEQDAVSTNEFDKISSNKQEHHGIHFLPVIFLIPVGIHFIIFMILSAFDPCKNNPGCMAGSLSGYFLFLFSVPTVFIILVAAMFQKPRLIDKFKKYFLINTSIAVLPFILSMLIYLLVG